MPELECVGGPLDGRMKHFYGDVFEYPDDPAPLVPSASDPEPRPRMGHYVFDGAHLHPRTGLRRSVWKWHPPPRPQSEAA